MDEITSSRAVWPRGGGGASTLTEDVVLSGSMPEVLHETVVTFASGATRGTGRVVRVDPFGPDRSVVVVDSTPFHPVDHTWPDQPADTGTLGRLPVVDAQIAAVGPEGRLLVGADVPVKRGEPGWTWLVAHLVAGEAPAPGTEVELVVDAGRRADLSASHTACHLAALAMNWAAARFWRQGKEVRRDSLGSPDLDQLAMVSSVMDRQASTDVYRFGKSLRKKGFDAASFADEYAGVAREVSSRLTEWVATRAEVRVDDGGDRSLSGFRRWVCALPEGSGEMPCGGTHLAHLGELVGIDVSYALAEDGSGMTVRTTPHRAP